MYWPHAIAGNGVVKDSEGGIPGLPGCLPGIPFCPSTDLTTRTFRQRSGPDRRGARATWCRWRARRRRRRRPARSAGILGLFQAWSRTATSWLAARRPAHRSRDRAAHDRERVRHRPVRLTPRGRRARPTQARLGSPDRLRPHQTSGRFQETSSRHGRHPARSRWTRLSGVFTLYDPTVQSTVRGLRPHRGAPLAERQLSTGTLEWALARSRPGVVDRSRAARRSAAFDGSSASSISDGEGRGRRRILRSSRSSRTTSSSRRPSSTRSPLRVSVSYDLSPVCRSPARSAVRSRCTTTPTRSRAFRAASGTVAPARAVTLRRVRRPATASRGR
jgi:hypothetical protein